jgi:hypothetical protein
LCIRETSTTTPRLVVEYPAYEWPPQRGTTWIACLRAQRTVFSTSAADSQ